jgi:hypothetical protein
MHRIQSEPIDTQQCAQLTPNRETSGKLDGLHADLPHAVGTLRIANGRQPPSIFLYFAIVSE